MISYNFAFNDVLQQLFCTHFAIGVHVHIDISFFFSLLLMNYQISDVNWCHSGVCYQPAHLNFSALSELAYRICDQGIANGDNCTLYLFVSLCSIILSFRILRKDLISHLH